MRHLKKRLKFSRPAKESKRLLRNLLANLILYERIKTTEAKAKKAKGLLDKLINIGKKGNLSAYRQLLKFFYIKEPAKKIIEDLAKRRKGDGAVVVIWELVEAKKEKKVAKTKNKTATKKKKEKEKDKVASLRSTKTSKKTSANKK